MDATAPAPEVTARQGVYEVVEAHMDALADGRPRPDVFDAPPLADAGPANVWVGGVVTEQQPHGMRGEQGPTYRTFPTVQLHVDVADAGAAADAVTVECWTHVAEVRQAIRNAVRDRHPWGDGIHHPQIVRTTSSGPVPLDGGGWAEQVLIEVQFTATI